MSIKSVKITATIVMLAMMGVMLGACKKGNDNVISSTVSFTKTTINSSITATRPINTPIPTTAGRTDNTAGTVNTDNVNTNTSGNYINDNQDQTFEQIENDEGNEQKTAEKIYDLKGRVIKFLIHAQTAELDPNITTGEKLDDVRNKLFKEAEKLFNCKFVFEMVAGGTGALPKIADTMLNAAMAGIYVADAYRINRSKILSLEKLNILLPLNKYIDFNEPKWQFYVDDHAYGLYNPQNIYTIASPANMLQLTFGLWYHEDILKREGIQNLCEYKDQKNWTWDTLLDIAVKTTKDINGDGIIDQWGLVSYSNQYTAQVFLYSNACILIASNGSGGYRYNLNNYKAMRPLQFVSDLYNTYKVIPNKNGESDFVNNKAAMFIRNDWYGSTFKKNPQLIDIRYEEVPAGPDNPDNVGVKLLGSLHNFFFPANLEDPEAVVNAFAYWQLLTDETKDYYVSYDEALRGYLVKTAYEVDYEHWLNNYTSHNGFIEDFYLYFSDVITIINNSVFKQIATVNTTAASAIAQIEYEINDIIDNALE